MFQKVTNAENARWTAPPSVRSDCHAKRPAARSDHLATYIAMVWLMTGSFSVLENCAAHDEAPHASCQDHARSERAERSGKLRYSISAITVGSPSQHPFVRLTPEGSNLSSAQTHYFRDRASSWRQLVALSGAAFGSKFSFELMSESGPEPSKHDLRPTSAYPLAAT